MKLMQALISALSTILLIGCITQAEPKLPDTNELRSVLDSTPQSTKVMGVSVAIIVPGYRPWLGASGESHPGQLISNGCCLRRAEDFAVWAHALFTGKMLKAFSLDEMFTFVPSKQQEMDGPLFVDYGLGIMEINTQLVRGQRTWGHLGSIPGYRAFMEHLTDHGLTMSGLMNSDTDGGFPILDGLLGIVLNNLEKK